MVCENLSQFQTTLTVKCRTGQGRNRDDPKLRHVACSEDTVNVCRPRLELNLSLVITVQRPEQKKTSSREVRIGFLSKGEVTWSEGFIAG